MAVYLKRRRSSLPVTLPAARRPTRFPVAFEPRETALTSPRMRAKRYRAERIFEIMAYSQPTPSLSRSKPNTSGPTTKTLPV